MSTVINIIVRVVAVISMGLLLPGSRDGAAQPSVQPAPATVLVKADTTDPVDCGRVPIGGMARRVFNIKNITDAAISLEVTGKSCACIVTRLGIETLAPGASTDLDVSVVVAGGFGVQAHSLRLEASRRSSSGKSVRQALDIGISFTPDRVYEVTPRLLVLRSVIGEAVSGIISVVTPPGSDLIIRDVDTGTDALTVQAPMKHPKNPIVHVLDFVCKPKQIGSHSSTLTFDTNSDSLPTGSVDVTIVGLTSWRADPPGLIVTYRSPDLASAARSALVPRRANSPQPSKVTLESQVPGVKVWLEADNVLMSIDLAKVPSRTGSTIARVESNEGVLCAELPVVWYARRTK